MDSKSVTVTDLLTVKLYLTLYSQAMDKNKIGHLQNFMPRNIIFWRQNR